MKKVRFFIEPYEDPDEYEEEDEDFGVGFASVEESSRIVVRAYPCPRCKRKLFDADVSLHGVIFIRCRRCRREVAIETVPIMRRIGFIDPLTYRKENKSHDPGSKALQKERKV